MTQSEALSFNHLAKLSGTNLIGQLEYDRQNLGKVPPDKFKWCYPWGKKNKTKQTNKKKCCFALSGEDYVTLQSH